MAKAGKTIVTRAGTTGGRWRLVSLVGAVLLLAAAPALAQGWWPWNSGPEQRAPPIPREPVYRDPDGGGQTGGRWGPSRSICLDLEQRLVQEGQRGNQSRDQLPAIESELRNLEAAYRSGEDQLERMNCYDYFLFSKTLRRTRRCVDLSNQIDASRRRIAELEAQRNDLAVSGGRSYQDEIIRELARNNCGANYEQQARRQQGFNPFSSLWEEEDTSVGGGYGNFSNLPYATYRTLCVRLCDGYYFPISFSTLPNHFERDAEVCQSKCAAPAELYYYQNPGAGVDQMQAARTNALYTDLKSAFRYRKEYVRGCSCNTAEYVPEAGAPEQQGSAAPGAATGGSPGTSTEQRAEVPPPAANLPWNPR